MKFKATEEEINEVKNLLNKEKSLRVRKRYHALYLWFLGNSYREIAKNILMSKSTVFAVINKYRDAGFEALEDHAYGGRPKKLSDEQEEKLKDLILTKLPVDVGFSAEFNWTSEIVKQYIEKEYGVKFCLSGVNAVLKRLNLSYTRPTYVLAKADKEKQDEFKKEFEGIKKTF
jgi:putative transposase